MNNTDPEYGRRLGRLRRSLPWLRLTLMLVCLNGVVWVAQPDTKPGLFWVRVGGSILSCSIPGVIAWAWRAKF